MFGFQVVYLALIQRQVDIEIDILGRIGLEHIALRFRFAVHFRLSCERFGFLVHILNKIAILVRLVTSDAQTLDAETIRRDGQLGDRLLSIVV